MQQGRVLVFGCSDPSTRAGLRADEKAVAACGLAAVAVSTGVTVREGGNILEVVETPPVTLQEQVDGCVQTVDVGVVKIGALFSTKAVDVVADVLRSFVDAPSVIDVEPIFKAGIGFVPKPEVIKGLREKILPSITILSATVPEAKALLSDAGITAEYPKNMGDVAEMAKTLRSLGPQYVLIKREIFDETSKMTTLHFVLCGEGEPLVVGARVENPKSVFGASYSIPPVIAANLGIGQDVPQAVSGAFEFVGEMIKGGVYFE